MTEFQTMYDRYARDVHRFALYLSGDPAQADDIASETFTRVWMARDSMRVSTAKAYLFAIARNLYREGLRKRKRLAPLDESHPDPAPGPHAAVEGRSELRAVLAALARLPEADRAALILRAEDGLPYDEIAGTLGLSVAAVKVKVHRARLRLEEARQALPKTLPATKEDR